MHGRLKIRTTEEEKERKKKEQALKVKAYRSAMTKIQFKRQQKQLDDEMLQLTTPLLLRIPDLNTLWNVRRECILEMSLALSENKEQLQSLYDSELGITEQCLVSNPKSYGAWHHRCWTLEHSPNANWNREVLLCNKYLKLDERNFHTWNYRRYVVAKAAVDKQKELDFCTDKIKVNFSNYSSWHYRSLLLPVLHPYEGDALPKRPMSEDKLQEELEMVLTAAFTDPNDSSAWFYQRWLLGNSRLELDVCAFRCDKERAVLAFTKPIAADDLCVELWVEGDTHSIQILAWTALNKTKYDTTWCAAFSGRNVLPLAPYAEYQLKVTLPTILSVELPLTEYAQTYYFFNAPSSGYAYTSAVLAELKSQLVSCMSLLEYEPESKWTLLTSALLMHAIDPQAYYNQSQEHLEKLQKVDKLREGYFQDLASKWILEKLLTDWSHSTDLPASLNLADEPQLSRICHAQYLCIANEVHLSTRVYNNMNSPLKTFGLTRHENYSTTIYVYRI